MWAVKFHIFVTMFSKGHSYRSDPSRKFACLHNPFRVASCHINHSPPTSRSVCAVRGAGCGGCEGVHGNPVTGYYCDDGLVMMCLHSISIYADGLIREKIEAECYIV